MKPDLRAQSLDFDLLKRISAPDIGPLTKSFKFGSGTVTPVAFLIPAGLITAGLIKDDHVLFVNGAEAGSAILLSSLASTGLKYAVRRKRPSEEFPGFLPKIRVRDPSFPSGHTTVAVASATALCLLYPRWYVISPSCLWVGGVAYSRMYLGVHFPTDILGGMVIGTGISILVHQARKWVDVR